MSFLTARQRDVLGFVAQRIAATGVAPTLQEISDHFGFSSTASAQKHVNLLRKKGFLRREKHQKRGLVVCDPSSEERSPRFDSQELPLLGVVAAGHPIEAIVQDETIEVPPHLLRSGNHFVLRVRGDSMIEDGIHDGDLVVVQRSESASDGQTVVALVDDEVTLKRLFHDGAQVRLQPANASMPTFVVPADTVRVQGVVVGLVRSY